MLIERFLIRPLYKRSIDDPLLLTFGLGYVLVEAVRIVFGSDGIPFQTPPELAAQFAGRAIGVGLAVWTLLGLFTAALWSRGREA